MKLVMLKMATSGKIATRNNNLHRTSALIVIFSVGQTFVGRQVETNLHLMQILLPNGLR